ncbi:hypothetical protein [Alkalihalobacillus sp. BA299]|uniref:hypothetical protein n=1 Tax=Alkalihalobacillus sp. BA299 TaxID=2815938 RepID=UPI001ADC12D4|nr:hypothetical protein [Alkalihalobacillus sp. BA299]
MKKLLLTAASTILAIGVLAACGDQNIEDPTLNKEPDFGTETEGNTGNFEEEPAIEEGTEGELPATEEESDDINSDLDMGDEGEESLEFESEENDQVEEDIEG